MIHTRTVGLALLLALATPAWGQGATSPQERSPLRLVGETVLMYYAGSTGGVLGAGLTVAVLNEAGASNEVLAGAAIAAYPIAIAASIYGTGSLLGVEGSFRNTLGDAVSGTAVGLAVGGAFTSICFDFGEGRFANCSFDTLGLILLGWTIAAIIPVVWAVADFRVAPTALRGTDGETAAGLSLRLGL